MSTVINITEEVTRVIMAGIQGPRGPGYTDAPYIDFDQILDPANQTARMAWDPESGTVRIGMPGGNVTLQVGQEQLARVRNKTGALIPNGSLVYISGATGQLAEITKASASSYDEATRTIAMATEDIDNNAQGYVNTFGIVRDLNTNGIPEGTMLYLGEAGAFTATPPAYPANRVAIGICAHEGNADGRVFFFPRFVFRKFGDPTGGDYTGFDDDGHLINYGGARTYNDLPPIPLLNQRVGMSNVPSLTTLRGNIQQLTFAIGDYVFGNYELTHEYAEGTDLSPHVHMATNGVDTTDRAVKWELEYSISNADAQAPYTEAFPVSTVITGETVIPANTPDRSHVLAFQLPDIPGASYKIGAYITYRLRRVAATGTAPTGNPFGLTLGFHVLQDTQGSDTVGQKTIA